jgi:fimbrial isopeptide formation D2 family protein
MDNSIPKHKFIKISTISLLVLMISLIALGSTVSNANATFVSLNKQHAPLTNFNQGDTITFTITLNVLDNPNGTAIAIRHLNITDIIPAGLTYVGGSETHTPTATFTPSGQTLFWDFGVSTVHSTSPQAVVTFRVTVNAGTSGLLVNQAISEYIEDLTQVYSNPGITDTVTVNPPPTPTPTPTPVVTPSPFPSQPSVGGEFAPVSMLELLAPYVVVAFIGAVAIATLVMYRKREE